MKIKRATKNKMYIGGDISDAELLRLYRRRFSLNQTEFGKLFGVTLQATKEWEKIYPLRIRRYKSKTEIAATEFLHFHYKEKILNGLTENEVCYILRIRANVLQRQIAEQRGTCRIWQHRIEAGLEPTSTHALFLFMLEHYGENK